MKISHAPQRITPCWKGRTLQHEPCGTCETLAGRAEPWGRTALMPPGRGGPLQQGAKPAHAGKGRSLPIPARGEACPFRQGVNPAHSGKGAASRTEVHPFQQGGLREVHPFQLPIQHGGPPLPARSSAQSCRKGTHKGVPLAQCRACRKAGASEPALAPPGRGGRRQDGAPQAFAPAARPRPYVM